MSYLLLFNIEKFLFSKACKVYGNTGLTKSKIVNTAANISYVNLLQAYEEYSNISDTEEEFKFKAYKNNEIKYLKKINIISANNLESKNNDFNITKYKRIIFITFESLSIDFINFYNKKIPEEASYYFNYLLKNYTHFDNFYTANMPTQEGLNAIINSRLDLDILDDTDNNKTLFSLLYEANYDTYLIKGISKFYGKDQKVAKELFRINNIIALEELEEEFGDNISSGWGVHNNTLYKKAVNLLLNTNNNILLFIKTIDFHLPGAYAGDINYPKNITNSDKIIKSIYWINKQLEFFIEQLKNKGLFDSKTIIFITADHNPHLGAEYKEYAIKNNYRHLAKIPLIILTSEPLKLKRTRKYFSQIDLLPTFFNQGNINTMYTGRNILESNGSFAMGMYQNIFYYNSEGLNFSFDLKKCFQGNLDAEREAICKYLYNTKSIKEWHQ